MNTIPPRSLSPSPFPDFASTGLHLPSHDSSKATSTHVVLPPTSQAPFNGMDATDVHMFTYSSPPLKFLRKHILWFQQLERAIVARVQQANRALSMGGRKDRHLKSKSTSKRLLCPGCSDASTGMARRPESTPFSTHATAVGRQPAVREGCKIRATRDMLHAYGKGIYVLYNILPRDGHASFPRVAELCVHTSRDRHTDKQGCSANPLTYLALELQCGPSWSGRQSGLFVIS